jgi:hypothetical protein
MSNIVIEELNKQVRAWEELISEGLEARELRDNSQWKLGDLAAEVETSYGEDTIGKYAYAVGQEKKTLMNYRTIALKFPEDIRTRYPRVSFSHFAVIANTEKPEAWLVKADDESWSVEHLRKEINEAYPKNNVPEMLDEPPEVNRCDTCGLWRLKDISSFEICRGHYRITKKGMIYE